MNNSNPLHNKRYDRAACYGVAFLAIGVCLFLYGGLSLFGLEQDPQWFFAVEQGLSPEKGQSWVRLLIGLSVMLLGIALILSSHMKKKELSKITSNQSR